MTHQCLSRSPELTKTVLPTTPPPHPKKRKGRRVSPHVCTALSHQAPHSLSLPQITHISSFQPSLGNRVVPLWLNSGGRPDPTPALLPLYIFKQHVSLSLFLYLSTPAVTTLVSARNNGGFAGEFGRQWAMASVRHFPSGRASPSSSYWWAPLRRARP